MTAFRRVLLLDSSLAPIKTISWQRAMILWFQQKALVLEHQTKEISSEKWSYKVPSVIQLKNYVIHQNDRTLRFSRRNIFFRDEFTCQYCFQQLAPQKLTLEHVLPRSRGGRTSWQNIVTACYPCNQKKEGRTPEEAGMRLRLLPSKPQSHDFFKFTMPDHIPDDWRPYVSWIKKSN